MRIKPTTLVVLTLASFGAGTLYCAKKMRSGEKPKVEEIYDAARDFLANKRAANA